MGRSGHTCLEMGRGRRACFPLSWEDWRKARAGAPKVVASAVVNGRPMFRGFGGQFWRDVPYTAPFLDRQFSAELRSLRHTRAAPSAFIGCGLPFR